MNVGETRVALRFPGLGLVPELTLNFRLHALVGAETFNTGDSHQCQTGGGGVYVLNPD